MKSSTAKSRKLSLLLILVCLLTGCTRNPNNKVDPYESYNRKMFAFNQQVDKVTLKPLAKLYVRIAPNIVQRGVSNFFSNLGEVQTVTNDLLQAKLTFALSDTWRFVINSTVGFAGLADVASHLKGLPKHSNDFGLTLDQWGVEHSFYLQVPLLGPSTPRDFVGIPADTFALSAWPHIKPLSYAWDLYGVYLLSLRAQMLPADPMIKQAFDPYVFVRDAYLQHRKNAIAKNKLSFKQYVAQQNNTSTAAEQPSEAPADFAVDDATSNEQPTTASNSPQSDKASVSKAASNIT